MKLFGALGLDIKIFVAQFVNFAILFFVLYKFGYRPIFDFLDKRRRGIEKGIQDAKDAEAKLMKIHEREHEVLAQARKESQDIIVAAQQLAKRNGEEIIGDAKKEVEKIVFLARVKIKEEQKRAQAEAKQALAGLVVSATEKVLSAKADAQKDRDLIARMIDGTEHAN